MDENILFSNADVTVSQQNLIVLGQTFAIQDINAVAMRLVRPKRIGTFILLLCGFLLLLDEGKLFALGGFSVLLGIVFWVSGGNKYAVVIKSSSEERQVLISNDRILIEKVIQALDAAMGNSGQNSGHPRIMSLKSMSEIPYRDNNDISFGAS